MKILKIASIALLTLFITSTTYAQSSDQVKPVKTEKTVQPKQIPTENVTEIRLSPDSDINLLTIDDETFDAIAYSLIEETAKCQAATAFHQYQAISVAGFMRMAGANSGIWGPAASMSLNDLKRLKLYTSFLKDLKDVSNKRQYDISKYLKQGNVFFIRLLSGISKMHMTSANNVKKSQEFWTTLFSSSQRCVVLTNTMNRLLKINLASDSNVTPEVK